MRRLISGLAMAGLAAIVAVGAAAQTPEAAGSFSVAHVLRDPGFLGGIVGAILGTLGGGFAAMGVARRSAAVTQDDARKQLVSELHRDFVFGSMLKARLRAELLLFYDVERKYKGKNFEDMYLGCMNLEEYADVAAVLNLFRLLDEYKDANRIDVPLAQVDFGWMYRWWFDNVIEPYSRGLDNSPDWHRHVSRKDWLYNS